MFYFVFHLFRLLGVILTSVTGCLQTVSSSSQCVCGVGVRACVHVCVCVCVCVEGRGRLL